MGEAVRFWGGLMLFEKIHSALRSCIRALGFWLNQLIFVFRRHFSRKTIVIRTNITFLVQSLAHCRLIPPCMLVQEALAVNIGNFICWDASWFKYAFHEFFVCLLHFIDVNLALLFLFFFFQPFIDVFRFGACITILLFLLLLVKRFKVKAIQWTLRLKVRLYGMLSNQVNLKHIRFNT